MKRKMRLLCDSNPMCYGSSASMLSILDHIDAEVTALVHGVTAEILEVDPTVDHTIATHLKDPLAVAQDVNLNRYDAVLVVANQSNIALYHDAGLPIFFVDILYFYGHYKTGPVWSLAQKTFVQRFPGVSNRLEHGNTPGAPIEVGPLIRTPSTLPKPPKQRVGTLVHLGGGRSQWVIPGENSPYPLLVARWLSRLREVLPKPITLATGREAAAVARAALGSDIEVGSFSQPEFLQRMRTCEIYLTTPGLGAVFEGGVYAQDMLLLPPQNATQVVQLEVYESQGVSPKGLNLPGLDPDFTRQDPGALTEQALTQEVLKSLHRLHERRDLDEVVCAKLLTALHNPTARHHALKQFMSELGTPGGKVVADAINTFWSQT